MSRKALYKCSPVTLLGYIRLKDAEALFSALQMQMKPHSKNKNKEVDNATVEQNVGCAYAAG